MPPERKFYLCNGECVTAENLRAYPDIHIIGELRYVADEGRKVTALALYERSVYVQFIPETLPVLRGSVVGDMRDIRCTLCGRKQRWEGGKAHLQAMLDRVLKLRKQGQAEMMLVAK